MFIYFVYYINTPDVQKSSNLGIKLFGQSCMQVPSFEHNRCKHVTWNPIDAIKIQWAYLLIYTPLHAAKNCNGHADQQANREHRV